MTEIKYNSEDVKAFGILGAIYLSNMDNLSKTGLSDGDIVNIEYMLSSLNVLIDGSINLERYNYYKLNPDSSAVVKASKDKRKKKEVKKQFVLTCLYNELHCNNLELKEEMKKWINAVIDKYGYMTKECVVNFKYNLDAWAKGDVNKAIELVKLATTLGYREFNWVVKKYNYKQTSSVRTTKQNRATLDDIDTTMTF